MAVLFVTAPNWKLHKCLWIAGWIKTAVYSHKKKQYTALLKKKTKNFTKNKLTAATCNKMNESQC